MEDSTFNPYQTPLSELAEQAGEIDEALRPRYRLFSVRSVMLATAIGSPWAGGVVMAVNYWRLGRIGAAVHAFVWTLLFSAALILLVVLLPDEVYIPIAVYILLQVGSAYCAATWCQGSILEEHRRRGGPQASHWAAAGIGLLVALAVALLVVGAAVAIESLLSN